MLKSYLKQKQLDRLFCNWKKELAQKRVYYTTLNKTLNAQDAFTEDGFFPGYWNQKYRILFIAREPNQDWDNQINSRRKTWEKTHQYPTNRGNDSFWRRVIGIVSRTRQKNLITTSSYNNCQNMAKKKNYGFAFMELSKYRNINTNNGKRNNKLINQFLSDSNLSKNHFIEKEINILSPSVIITMDIFRKTCNSCYLDLIFKDKQLIYSLDGYAQFYSVIIQREKYYLIDLFHFSAYNYSKYDDDYFYKPALFFIKHFLRWLT